jgi:solute carrier family 15 (peptide/histidine transporter), member 3/4
MEVEAVESNASRGGADHRPSSKKDRRVFWACVFIFGSKAY